MQQINSNLALVQAQQKCHMPNSSMGKPKEPLSDFTVAAVLALFARMGALFRNKARSDGLLIFANKHDEEHEIYTDTFKLWCVKLRDLTAADFERGTLVMEKRAMDLYQQGEEMWPPSFAEFRALAFQATSRDTQAHNPFERLPALEDKTAREKRYELGRQESRRLLDMFGDTKPNPKACDETQGRQRLEEAKKRLQEQVE